MGPGVEHQSSDVHWVGVDEAIAILRAGGLVALPTETVYGLGANALDPVAIARIFKVKRRPEHHPLIVHLSDADHLLGWAEVPDLAWVLAEHCWPGPLTIVLRRGPLALDVTTGGLPTVGLRVPAHPLTQAVLAGLGGGVAAPSANRFGHISPTTANHVAQDLAYEVDGILDGGPCEVGIESTIIDLSGLSGPEPRLLRQGAIPIERLAELLGRPVALATEAPRRGGEARATAPGQLASHYAPHARLEVVPAFALAAAAARGKRTVILGEAELGTTARSWAQNLYAALRTADLQHPDVILVPPPPSGALAAAVLDRLCRAAAPRPEVP